METTERQRREGAVFGDEEQAVGAGLRDQEPTRARGVRETRSSREAGKLGYMVSCLLVLLAAVGAIEVGRQPRLHDRVATTLHSEAGRQADCSTPPPLVFVTKVVTMLCC